MTTLNSSNFKVLWASRRGPKQHREGAALEPPTASTASAGDAQGRASTNPHGRTGFRHTAAFLHQQKITDRKAVRHVAAGSCQQNPHGTEGCRARVHASGCYNNPHKSKGQMHCCWDVSTLVEAPRISRDVPAKTLTEQGAAVHMSKLLDVVTTITYRKDAIHVASGRCRGS